jgi:signal transduction histidine kinase
MGPVEGADAGPRAAEVAAAARAAGFTMEGQALDVPPDRPLLRRAFLGQETVFSDDVLRDDPQAAALYRALDVRAVVVAPLTSGKRRVGVLTIRSPRASLFAVSDVELARLLAIQATAVLESRRLLEEAAHGQAREEASRLKDEFLASISHDLRNPLAAVQGVAQLLQRRLARDGTVDPARLAAALRNITSATAQMTALTEQLLDHARLQLDRPLELDRRPTDLVELARRTVETHAAASEGHRVRLEAAGAPLVGEWDPARLERVLQNLLANATKYSPQGGEIVVRVWRERAPGTGGGESEEWAVFSVRDQGIGIPADDVPRIFERYGRAANVRGRIAGTGIGLATARWIVEQHGGTIAVQSEEGRGSTFTVRLPLGPSDAADIPPDPEGGSSPVPEARRPPDSRAGPRASLPLLEGEPGPLA